MESRTTPEGVPALLCLGPGRPGQFCKNLRRTQAVNTTPEGPTWALFTQNG